MIQKVPGKNEESKFKTYCELTLNQLFISSTQIVEMSFLLSHDLQIESMNITCAMTVHVFSESQEPGKIRF